MFLSIDANPHQAGRLTRTVRYTPAPGQTWAIDAERLHREPGLLDAFTPHAAAWLRMLDALAYLLLVAGVAASFFLAIWMFAPGVVACSLMLAVNRKSAGEVARRAAQRSVDDFRRLHEMGVLWLIPA